MTPTTDDADPTDLSQWTVTVAVLSHHVDRVADVIARLADGDAPHVVWQVQDARRAWDAHTDIAVTDELASVAAVALRWPTAAIIALVPDTDEGEAVRAALSAGADVCVRGNNPVLIAAYLKSVARRRGLLPKDLSR